MRLKENKENVCIFSSLFGNKIHVRRAVRNRRRTQKRDPPWNSNRECVYWWHVCVCMCVCVVASVVCLTRRFRFIRDDTTDEVRCSAPEDSHQVVELFLREGWRETHSGGNDTQNTQLQQPFWPPTNYTHTHPIVKGVVLSWWPRYRVGRSVTKYL